MNVRFRVLRRLVRLHRWSKTRRVGLFLVPKLNAGCIGVRVGSWYADTFCRPTWGFWISTGFFRGWIWPLELRIRRQR